MTLLGPQIAHTGRTAGIGELVDPDTTDGPTHARDGGAFVVSVDRRAGRAVARRVGGITQDRPPLMHDLTDVDRRLVDLW
jgi:hypothetical protein